MKQPERTQLIQAWSAFLKKVPIFSQLDDNSLREAAEKLQPLSVSQGDTVFSEGDQGDALYIIESGRVRIVAGEDRRKEKVINYLGRGETFGAVSLFTGAPRDVTVKADMPSHFLVLKKYDFETFLKQNPSLAFLMSRMVSRQLLMTVETKYAPSAASSRSDIVGLAADLPSEDRVVFVSNLCLTLAAQTRKKILLLELNSDGQKLARSLGLEPVIPSPSVMTDEDLHDPKVLERLAVAHPSGMEVITLPYEIFLRGAFRSLSPMFAALRKIYDFVVVDMNVGAGESFILDAVSAAVLKECDSVYYAASASGEGLLKLEELLLREEIVGRSSEDAPIPGRLKTIFLQTGEDSFVRTPDFILPWKTTVLSNFKKTGFSHFTEYDSGDSPRMLQRIARSIGGLQVGLVLGAGGAHAYAIVGVLKVLERAKIPIDYIAGTSMGALLGAFYASGKSAEEVEGICNSISRVWVRQNFLSDMNLPWPKGGILIGDTISKFLKGHLGEKTFADLRIPLACVATDILTGDEVVLREGKVWEAVRASLSLPLLFKPHRIGDRFLVDGGLNNPVPISVAASMGADILVSVDLSSKQSERVISLRHRKMFPSSQPGMLHIFMKMIFTMQCEVASARAGMAHVTIHPSIPKNASWLDFHRARQIIPLGEEAAEECLPQIKSHLPFFSGPGASSSRSPRAGF